MFRLLIVDNEPNIVNGLHELFLERSDALNLDIVCAYSADEALAWLARIKIDIVLADIRMPGMTGLELHLNIIEQWPRCKVIFLTGFTEFEYVHTAIRQGAADYLLKTEEDEQIILSVEKALASITHELETDGSIKLAREQMSSVAEALRKEYLLQYLNGEQPEVLTRRLRRFTELSLPLAADRPALIVVGKVDMWYEAVMSSSDKALLFYAIRNIAEEFLTGCLLVSVAYDHNKFVWFIQPEWKEQDNDDAGAVWNRTITFVTGMIDSIQSTCKQLLKLPLSFVVGSSIREWHEISSAFLYMKSLLIHSFASVGEMIVTDQLHSPEALQESMVGSGSIARKWNQEALTWNQDIHQLGSYIENTQREPFFRKFDELTVVNKSAEIYYGVAVLLLPYVKQQEAGRLMNLDSHTGWEGAVRYLRKTAMEIFDLWEDDHDERSDELVDRIHRYIDGHLDSDLSLARIAEEVYFHPTYLCRLYKQMTGNGLSAWINEARLARAKEMLSQPQWKIHEIAQQVGLSTSYFIRMFKKYMAMTPQEYRDCRLSNK